MFLSITVGFGEKMKTGRNDQGEWPPELVLVKRIHSLSPGGTGWGVSRDDWIWVVKSYKKRRVLLPKIFKMKIGFSH